MKSLIVTLLDFVLVLLVIVLGIVLIYVFTNETARQSLQGWVKDAEKLVNELPDEIKQIDLPGTGVAETQAVDLFRIEKKNLVENLPVSNTPLPTTVLGPVEYRNEILLRVRHFANALEGFFESNEKVSANPELMGDAEWRRETQIRLDLFTQAAWDLGELEPAPPEYAHIQAILREVGPQAQSMRDHYLLGIETGSHEEMRAAGEALDTIYAAMAQAERAMIEAGWQP